MRLVSVNIGRERSIPNAKASGKTGIYKLPVEGLAQITSSGLTGDAICDVESHGGRDQAVYVYGVTDYVWWSTALDQELSPGTFGENLTIDELASDGFCIGDRLHVGAVILEVTAPRIPCGTLAARMDDPSFAKRFRIAERPGLYCRVVREGWVQVGDEATHERYSGERVTVIEMFRDFFEGDLNEAALRRYLVAPIASRDRVEKEQQLQRLLARRETRSNAEK